MTPRPVPTGYVPVERAETVSPSADFVRGFYRVHEAQQRHARVGRARSGVAVLREFAVLEGVA